ncbi:MAG: carbohydrate-binding protein, partial [Oligoflexia bacterium]|nr:carbohydrate-binding protein [Oligoflexia bacterium]
LTAATPITLTASDFIYTSADQTFTSGNDTLTGTPTVQNILFGGDGNDTLTAGNMGDYIHGGSGNDSIIGGQGHDTLAGGSGNDTLTGGYGADSITGDTGDDHLYPDGQTFTNTTVSGLQLWLDGNDPYNTGTIPSNNTAITNWIDKSGNSGRNANTTTGSPTFKQNQTNISGRSAIYFDGVDDSIRGLTNALTFTNASMTSFISVDINAASTNNYRGIFSLYGPNNVNDHNNVNSIAAFQYTYENATPGAVGAARIVGATSVVPLYYPQDNYTNLGLKLDNGTYAVTERGTSKFGPSSYSDKSNMSIEGYILSCRWGGGAPNGEYGLNSISEVLVYNVALSTSNYQTVENYLAYKSGIPLTGTTFGVDMLTGGAGADTFYWSENSISNSSSSSRDRITDFSQAQGDKINLAGFTQKIYVLGNTSAFDGRYPGEMIWTQSGSDTIIKIDFGTDTVSDFEIQLDNFNNTTTPLSVNDFVFATNKVAMIGTTAGNSLSAGTNNNYVLIGGYNGDTLVGGTGADTIYPDNINFVASSISGLQVWYDAFDPNTSGNNLIANSSVSSWKDKSGNNNHAISSETARPLYSSNTFNSKYPTIVFDGVNDILGSTSNITLGAHTIYSVVSSTFEDKQYPIIMELGPNSNTNDGLYLTAFNGGTLYVRKGGVGSGKNHSVYYWLKGAGPSFVTHAYNGTHASNLFYINGETISLTDGPASNPGTGSTSNILYLGNRQAVTGYEFKGNASEFIVYNGSQSTAVQKSVEEYLSFKWGIVMAGLSFGNDALTGGSGADTFVWTNSSHSGVGEGNRDIITDFSQSVDKIDISNIQTILNNKLLWLGPIDPTANPLSANKIPSFGYVQESGITLVKVDRNGDGTAEMEIELTAATPITLTTNDFIYTSADQAYVAGTPLTGTPSVSNVLFGGDGNDTITAGDMGDYLFGGSGIDTITGGKGNDLLAGGSSNDTLTGSYGGDTIYGDTGDDTIYGDNQKFDPKALFNSNLVLWLNASDPRADKSGVIVGDHNADFLTWKDRSAYLNSTPVATPNNLTAPNTTTGKATLMSSAVNGRPAFDFDGNDYYEIAYKAGLNSANMAVFFVANPSVSDGNPRSPLTNRASYPFKGFMFYTWSCTIGNYDGWNSSPYSVPATPGIPAVNALTVSTNTFTHYFNGTSYSILPTPNTTPYVVPTANPLRVGTGNTEGGAAYFMIGAVPEVIMINRAITSSELDTVNKYLSLKYGIPVQGTPIASIFGVDTLTGGLGNDTFVWNNFSYSGVGSSANRDKITDFTHNIGNANAENDKIFFDYDVPVKLVATPASTPSNMPEVKWTNGNPNIVSVDWGGDGTADMEIEITSNTNTLVGNDFIFNYVFGTSYSDTLIGSNNGATLVGGYSGDTLIAGSGSDTIYPDGQSFTASSVLNMILWLDASDYSTLTYDGSNLVSQWNDKSGNGFYVYDTTSGTSTDRPTFVRTTAIGNSHRSVLRFDGGDMLTDNGGMSASKPTDALTLFVLGRRGADGNATKFLSHGAGSDGRGFEYSYSNTGVLSFYPRIANAGWGANASTSSPDAMALNQMYITMGLLDKSGSNVITSTALDGGTVHSSTVANGPNNISYSSPNVYLSVGSHQYGDTGGIGFYTTGDIAEIIYYSRALTSSEYSIVNQYLSYKYAIPLSGLSLGVDTLTGGTGADTFLWTNASHSGVEAGNRDIITDFSQAQGDKINISTLIPTGFVWQGTSALISTGVPSFNYEKPAGGPTVVHIDFGGDGTSDMDIELTGEITLTKSDFIFNEIPTVLSVSALNDANEHPPYPKIKLGEEVHVRIQFSTAISITGEVRLLLDMIGVDRNTDPCTLVTTDTLECNYTATSDDVSNVPLDYVNEYSLTLLNGATIKNSAGTISAYLTLPPPGILGSLSDKGLSLDGQVPVPSITIATPSSQNSLVTATLTFPESLQATPLTLSNFGGAVVTNGEVVGVTMNSTNNYTLNIVPLNENLITVSLPANSVSDLCGNNNAASTMQLFSSQLLATMQDGVATNGTTINYLAYPIDIHVDDLFLYIIGAGDAGLTMIDISVPATPIVRGQYSVDSTPDAFNLGLKDGYAYINHVTANKLHTLSIAANIATPLTIVPVATPINLSESANIFIYGNQAYCTGNANGTIKVFDISTAYAPSLTSTYTNTNLYKTNGLEATLIRGHNLYRAADNSGLDIINISNGTPVSFTSITGTRSILFSDKYVALTRPPDKSVSFYDISNPVSPTLSKTVSIPNAAANTAYGEALYQTLPFLFVANYPGSEIQVVDFSTMASAYVLDHKISTTGNPHALAYKDGYLYSGNYSNRAQIFKIYGPESAKIGNRNLVFDGVNDYVNIPHHSDFNIGNNSPLTLEAWVKAYSFPRDFNNIIDKSSSDSDGNYRFCVSSARKVVYWGYGTGVATGNTALNPFQWYHLAFVSNADGSSTIYVNGEVDATSALTTSRTTNTAPVTIGWDRCRASNPTCPAERFWDGEIDEVRIWNVARSANQIKTNMNRRLSGSESGLVSYYRFDEPGGSTVTQTILDSSLKGHDGTLGASSAAATDDPVSVESTSNMKNYGVYFSPNTGAFLLRNENIMNSTTKSTTFEGWFNIAKAPTSSESMISLYSNPNSINLYLNTDRTLKLCSTHTTTQCSNVIATSSGTDVLPIGEWTHLAFSFRAGSSENTGRIYLNGRKIASGTKSTSGDLISGTDAIYMTQIGSTAALTVKDVRLLKRVVPLYADSAGAIQEEMKIRKEMIEFQGAAADLLAFFPMSEGSGQYAYDVSANLSSSFIFGYNNGVEATYDPKWRTISEKETRLPRHRGIYFDDSVPKYAKLVGGLNLIDKSFSISMWVKAITLSTGYECFLGMGSSGTANNKLVLCYGDGDRNKSLIFAFYANDLDSTYRNVDSEWHNLSFTYDATTKARKIYKDGELFASDTSPNNYTGSGDLIIGYDGASPNFKGYIDDVRIWSDRVVSASEVKEYMSRPLRSGTSDFTNLAVYYKMDEEGGQYLVDSSGNRRHAILGSGATLDSNDPVRLILNPYDNDSGPSGFSVAFVNTTISNSNKTAAEFNIIGAEKYSSYDYTVTSSGGGSTVTGSGVVSSYTPPHRVTGVNLSSPSDGTLTLALTLTDLAGNTTGTPATTTIQKNTTVPSVILTSSSSALGNNNAVPVTITFSASVTGLTEGEITVTNGTKSGLSGSGTTYTVNITPTSAGNFTVYVPADVVTEGNSASNTLTLSRGNRSANTITGSTGNDLIIGGYGGDLINGGEGDDTLYADDYVFSTSSVSSANMQMWFDASDPYNNGSVPANNVLVGRWKNKYTSDASKDFSLSSDYTSINTAPTFKRNQVNGRPVFSFDGTDDILYYAGGSLFSFTRLSVYSVGKMKHIEGVDYGTYMSFSPASGDPMQTEDGLVFMDNKDSGGITAVRCWLCGDGNDLIAGFALNADYVLHSQLFDSSVANNGTYYVYENALQKATDTYANTNSVDPVSFSLGFSLKDGRPDYRRTFAEFAEVIIFDNVFTVGTQERERTENYLAMKYARALDGLPLGVDVLTGSSGADTFIWTNASYSGLCASSACDRITDFNPVEDDKIQLEGFSEVIHIIGTSAFSASGNTELRWYYSDPHTIIAIDWGGDGVSDFEIRLDNFSSSLGASDFKISKVASDGGRSLYGTSGDDVLYANYAHSPNNFAPIMISGATMWFDANDPSTLSTTSDGAAVSSWTNKGVTVAEGTVLSSITQATEANRPVYHANERNGRSALYFDGGDTLSQATVRLSSIFSASENTGFTVLKNSTLGANHTVLSTGNSKVYWYLPHTDGNSRVIYDYGDGWPAARIQPIIADYSAGSWDLFDLYRKNGNAEVFLNGTSQGTGTGLTGCPWTTTVDTSLTIAEYAFNGFISEIISYNTALSTTQQRYVREYLSSKYRLTTTSLPTREAETLHGGAGADTFVFTWHANKRTGDLENRDVIADFSSSEGDKIDLSDFGLKWKGNSDTFNGGGSKEVRWYADGSNVIVYIDSDGLNGTDFEIELTNVSSLSASDFILYRLDFSYAKAIDGGYCAAVTEGSENAIRGWENNYVCSTSDIGISYSETGVVAGKPYCLNIGGTDTGWDNNYICYNQAIGGEFNTGNKVTGKLCTSMNEPLDEHSWYNNWLCWGTSSAGNVTKQAESSDSKSASVTNEATYASFTESGAYAIYNSIDFNGKSSIDINYANDSGGNVTVTIKIDSAGGTTIATKSLATTGGATTFTTVNVPISVVDSTHHLYIEVTGAGAINIDYLTIK